MTQTAHMENTWSPNYLVSASRLDYFDSSFLFFVNVVGALLFVFPSLYLIRRDFGGFQSFSSNRACCLFLFFITYVTASIVMCLSRLLMLLCIPLSSTNSSKAVNKMVGKGSFIFMKLTMCCATRCLIKV